MKKKLHHEYLLVRSGAALVQILPLWLIIAGMIYGGVKLWEIGLQDRVFAILPSVSLDQPAGLHPEAVQEFTRLSNFTAGKSLLDPHLIDTIRRQYTASVWIKQVCRIERVFPNQILVEFIPRRAFFQVEQNGYFWLVDEENILLPVNGGRSAHGGLPTVSGNLPPRPRAGEKWCDAGITAAHEVLAAWEKSPLAARLPINEIVLKRAKFTDKFRQEQQSRARLEIRTHHDVEILWGAGERGDPDELTTEQKIALLQQLLRRTPPALPNGGTRKISYDVRTAIAGYVVQ